MVTQHVRKEAKGWRALAAEEGRHSSQSCHLGQLRDWNGQSPSKSLDEADIRSTGKFDQPTLT